MTFLTIFGVKEILCSFRVVIERETGGGIEIHSFRLFLEGETGEEISESSIVELLEIFSANNLALSHAEGSTSRLLNRGGIADLPLLRTLLAVPQKSQEPSFWEVMDSFVLLA